MSGLELVLATIIGLLVLVLFVALVTGIVIKIQKEKIFNMENLYLGKMSNTDSPIQDAVEFLKLTNGIKSDGELH